MPTLDRNFKGNVGMKSSCGKLMEEVAIFKTEDGYKYACPNCNKITRVRYSILDLLSIGGKKKITCSCQWTLGGPDSSRKNSNRFYIFLKKD